jgi:hypothetical protein
VRTIAKSLVAVLAVGAVTSMAVPASAEIVCNAEGDCWHVHRHYDYKPEFGLVVHPDNWAWAPSDHFTWREHVGRGYWRNGVWITF